MFVTLADGKQIECDDQPFSEGGEGLLYWDKAGQHVIKLYKNADPSREIALQKIIGTDYSVVLNEPYWGKLFAWPKAVIKKPQLGLIMQRAPKDVMELKWFLGRKQRQVIVKLYGRKKLGQWADYLTLAIKMAQVVRRLHFRGLCHSDLSFRNFLVDPQTEQLILIDCDGLVVPGFLPANVLGTPQCMAPELAAQLLPNSPQAIPSTQTDLHALATLIYWMLMWRHPLIGPKVHDPDPFVDEALALGKNALFIEHPVDTSNRPDNIAIDYTKLLTPAVQHLVERAFVDGLHQPAKRPSAAEWERALHRMRDALVYCENKDCPLGTFVLSSSNQPTCLCGTPITRTPCLPILHFYRPRHGRVGHFQNDRDYFLVGQNKRHLYIWHADPTQSPGPNVDDTPKAILRYNGRWEKWYFKNSALPDVRLLTPNRSDIAIPPGTQTELVDGARLLLGPPDRCRLAYVRMMRMDNKQ